ncbi:hypothetical protein BZA05DRAFT_245213 [Tricharina praecox]|uniref:uncharacterized protein n=1 Tax=Tricharina praecox TaxID=43433 RepID=UPI002220B789|nr:uncharacterized protein BZA05DRAFT_245213 [Tricharina praecox]KAI5854581.1 hypothetical protein BZA05DRAFT_245213 [Tricharina praecox]
MASALVHTPPASSAAGPDNRRGAAPSTNSNSRHMRLKVSYSFDEDKNNCLARWPTLITSPVVQVDRDLQVGAVEFKTCILSIIAGSPELVARLGPDYSIYAYDYSEPDIPLVGCGMLSWAMLNTESSATRMMVTGRVNSNTFVFLGNNNDVRETLEVKIKLQKVDTFTQEQFVNSVHAYQALSRTLDGGFDAARWSSFLNDNPRVLTTALPLPSLPPPPPPPSPLVRPSATAHGPPPLAISEPPRMANTQEWKESGVSSSEDIVEPPKKRRRMPAKPHGPKKKAPVVNSEPDIPAATPSADLGQMSDVPLPPPRKTAKAPKRQPALPPPPPPLRLSRSRESSIVSQPSISRQSTVESTPGAISEITPSPRPTGPMASSPPGQLDIVDATTIPSPAPTSPVLPFLPPPQTSQPASRRLETLFEEPEPPRVKEEEPQSDCVPQLPQLPLTGLLLPALPPPPPPLPQREAINPPAPTEDISGSAALSHESSQLAKVSAKPKKKSKKKDPLTSDAVVPSSEIGDDSAVGGKRGRQTVAKPSRTAAHVKARIEMQLIESVQRGEMPSYCQNCGAIETAVWRKVAPPADTPDETEKAGQIRREKEILLCNACGLWFMSHKTMRPQSLWESNDPYEKLEKPEKGAKGANPRKRKKSATAPTPPSSNLQIASEACTEPIVLADDEDEETPRAVPTSTRRIAMSPSANRSGSNSEWKAVIDENRRAACSSPLVTGSADSPIDLDAVVDGMPSPKRTLFPEARKSSPEKPVGLPMTKRAPGKENLSPEEEEDSSQETTSTVPGPTTPIRRATGYQLRTPMRSATRSMQQSSPSKRIPRPPETPSRRLLKSPENRRVLSPVAGLLEKLLAEEASVLADIDEITAFNAGDMTFDLDDPDFLNTDYTMPSSPLPSSPPTGFAMYSTEDWDDFLPSTPNGSIAFDGPVDSGEKITVDLSAFIEEHSGGIVIPPLAPITTTTTMDAE